MQRRHLAYTVVGVVLGAVVGTFLIMESVQDCLAVVGDAPSCSRRTLWDAGVLVRGIIGAGAGGLGGRWLARRGGH